MRVVLDACVLYPTVLRELLLGAAEAGLFTPLCSARILEEWARAVECNLPDQAAVARTEIALLKSRWPEIEVPAKPDLQARLVLPDPDDTHVLTAAITGRATVLVTANAADFPHRVLAKYGILRRDPDGFLCDFLQDHRAVLTQVCQNVRQRASEISARPQDLRLLLKKARLPRLSKAMSL